MIIKNIEGRAPHVGLSRRQGPKKYRDGGEGGTLSGVHS